MIMRLVVQIIFAGAILLALTRLVVAHDAAIDQVLTRMSGTIDVHFEPYMTEGKLTGCQLVFIAITQDWKYRQGGYVKVVGNVGLLRYGNGLGSNVKIVLMDIDTADSNALFKPATVTRAYLVGQDYQTNLSSLVKSGPSDTPGALFSVFQISPTFEIVMSALETGKLTIAFNRGNGDSDLQIPLELDVQSVNDNGDRLRSNNAKTGFLNCLSALMK